MGERVRLTLHEESPARTKVPSAHGSHACPTSVLPALQVEQYVEPLSFSGAPLVQAEQLAALEWSEKVPLPHNEHAVFDVLVHC